MGLPNGHKNILLIYWLHYQNQRNNLFSKFDINNTISLSVTGCQNNDFERV